MHPPRHGSPSTRHDARRSHWDHTLRQAYNSSTRCLRGRLPAPPLTAAPAGSPCSCSRRCAAGCAATPPRPCCRRLPGRAAAPAACSAAARSPAPLPSSLSSSPSLLLASGSLAAGSSSGPAAMARSAAAMLWPSLSSNSPHARSCGRVRASRVGHGRTLQQPARQLWWRCQPAAGVLQRKAAKRSAAPLQQAPHGPSPAGSWARCALQALPLCPRARHHAPPRAAAAAGWRLASRAGRCAAWPALQSGGAGLGADRAPCSLPRLGRPVCQRALAGGAGHGECAHHCFFPRGPSRVWSRDEGHPPAAGALRGAGGGGSALQHRSTHRASMDRPRSPMEEIAGGSSSSRAAWAAAPGDCMLLRGLSASKEHCADSETGSGPSAATAADQLRRSPVLPLRPAGGAII